VAGDRAPWRRGNSDLYGGRVARRRFFSARLAPHVFAKATSLVEEPGRAAGRMGGMTPGRCDRAGAADSMPSRSHPLMAGLEHDVHGRA